MSENVQRPTGGIGTEEDPWAEALEKCQQFVVPVGIVAEVYHEIGNALSVLLPAIRLARKHFDRVRDVLAEFRGIDPALPTSELREEIARCRKMAGRGRGIDHDLVKLGSSFDPCLRELELIRSASEQLRQARESGDVVPAPVDVSSEVEQIVDFFSDHLRSEKNIQISFVNGAPGGLWVACSPDEISYIMKNLVHNAADAINEKRDLGLYPAGGERSIRIEIAKQNGFARIRCRDNGAGMTDEVKKRIFDPFFTTKSHFTGTGVGLSIVKEIIDRRGGKVEFTSKRCEGTEFVIDLPLCRGDVDGER
ncbi:MAG TPA: HAMP domain-containing sensor histidine kinase [bacterium]|nr:HAMP domain-containing sensor histidine kinase [bacterium]